MSVTLTKADVLLVAPELSSVADATWEVYLGLAKQLVDGADWADEATEEEAARFLAAHLATVGGLGLANGGLQVVSQSVGGVSVSFAQPSADSSGESLQSTRYGRLYRQIAAPTLSHVAVT